MPKAQPGMLEELLDDWWDVLIAAATIAAAVALLVVVLYTSSPATPLAAAPLAPPASVHTLMAPPTLPPLLIEAAVEPMPIAELPLESLPLESLSLIEPAQPAVAAVDEWYLWWVQSGWSGVDASELQSLERPSLLPTGVSLLGEWTAIAGSLFLIRRYRAAQRRNAAAAAAAEAEEGQGESTPTKPAAPGSPSPAFPGFLTPAVSRFISFAASPEGFRAPGTLWKNLSPQSVAASVRRSVRIATLTKAPKHTAAAVAVPEEEPMAPFSLAPASVLRRSVRPRRMSTRMRGAV